MAYHQPFEIAAFHSDIVKNAHARFTEACKNSAKPIPVNKGAIRKLDCSVIKYVHQSTENKGLPAYDTVRSAFNEGGQIYPESNFYDRLHIEICVRTPNLIKGYFLPRPIHEFNPYLKKDFTPKRTITLPSTQPPSF